MNVQHVTMYCCVKWAAQTWCWKFTQTSYDEREKVRNSIRHDVVCNVLRQASKLLTSNQITLFTHTGLHFNEWMDLKIYYTSVCPGWFNLCISFVIRQIYVIGNAYLYSISFVYIFDVLMRVWDQKGLLVLNGVYDLENRIVFGIEFFRISIIYLCSLSGI